MIFAPGSQTFPLAWKRSRNNMLLRQTRRSPAISFTALPSRHKFLMSASFSQSVPFSLQRSRFNRVDNWQAAKSRSPSIHAPLTCTPASCTGARPSPPSARKRTKADLIELCSFIFSGTISSISANSPDSQAWSNFCSAERRGSTESWLRIRRAVQAATSAPVERVVARGRAISGMILQQRLRPFPTARAPKASRPAPRRRSRARTWRSRSSHRYGRRAARAV
jgi:hypothetical protein